MAKPNSTEKEKKKKHFFKDLRAELKKVIWPTPKQLVNNTIVVITIVLLTAAIVFLLDSTFKALNEYGVDKLKEAVVNTTSQNTENENTNNDTNTTEDNTEKENQTQNDTVAGNEATQENQTNE